jgi:ASC-1-like (ASCH) protein
MEHLAILKKQWKLVDKITSGRKTIESRWYMSKRIPWGKVNKGDVIYFKESGEPVTIKAKVERVEEYILTPEKVEQIFISSGDKIGIEENQIGEFINRFKNKKYCILVYFEQPKRIVPFNINKEGYGIMAAWITVSDIDKIKLL